MTTQAPPAPIYQYSIDAGGPTNYPMIYSYYGSFFADKRGDPFLNFYPPGDSVAYWSHGGQATLASERNILASSLVLSR